MRHAEATHNANKHLKQVDPELTFKGFNNGGEQSTRVGYFLKPIFKPEYNNFFFVSKLRRTRQTLAKILSELDLNQTIPSITVLPCTHEIKYYPGGKCNSRIKTTPSDTMICNIDDLSKCSYINQFPINWKYYLDFYQNKKSDNCSDTNMIKLALNFIKSSL